MTTAETFRILDQLVATLEDIGGLKPKEIEQDLADTLDDAPGIFECKYGHKTKDVDIPDYGLDLYCPICLPDELSTLDLVDDGATDDEK